MEWALEDGWEGEQNKFKLLEKLLSMLSRTYEDF